MKVEARELTPAETLASAEAWFARQVEALRLCHGNKWPERREWIENYLAEELRQRLVAIGWRTKE